MRARVLCDADDAVGEPHRRSSSGGSSNASVSSFRATEDIVAEPKDAVNNVGVQQPDDGAKGGAVEMEVEGDEKVDATVEDGRGSPGGVADVATPAAAAVAVGGNSARVSQDDSGPCDDESEVDVLGVRWRRE